MTSPVSFAQGLGRWAGNAEVFDSAGRFLGNGADYRHVQAQPDDRVRIDVSFVGPFKHSGHYIIHDRGDHRLYEGPANIGYAETLSASLVDAHAYWPALGLSQRFFLMVVDDHLQLSLAHMTRGEHLLYVVVGQNERVPADAPNPQPNLVSGIHYDLAADPAAGRVAVLLHRPGRWHGTLSALNAARQPLGQFEFAETVRRAAPTQIHLTHSGGAFDASTRQMLCHTDHWHGWATADSDVVGSYSLSGGRALSGQFYHRAGQLRCWRREVATLDGQRKAVVQHWYRGGERVGVQFGVLTFTAETTP